MIQMKKNIKKIINRYFPRVLRNYQLKNYINSSFPYEFKSHVKNLKKKDIVFDLGANIGFVTEYLAMSGAHVIAFEPNKNAYQELVKFTSNFQNIDFYNVAAGIKNRKVKLYLHKNTKQNDNELSQASSLLINKSNVSKEIYDVINEIDFAVFLQNFKRIELIKIDIEGYEVDLINHLLDKNSLDNVGKIYLETHESIKNLKQPTIELKERIKKMGFADKFYFDWY